MQKMTVPGTANNINISITFFSQIWIKVLSKVESTKYLDVTEDSSHGEGNELIDGPL